MTGIGTASALWNLAYDAGYGAGPAVFGLFAGRTGYPAAFALTGLLMLAALPAGWRERSAKPAAKRKIGRPAGRPAPRPTAGDAVLGQAEPARQPAEVADDLVR